MIRTIVMFLYLSVLSVSDIKSRKIPNILLKIGLTVSFLCVSAGILISGPPSELIRRVMTALLGAVPGLLLTVLSNYSDKIGRGDGMVLLIIGMTENYTFSMILICTACLVLAFLSGILMVLHKVTSKTRMPYIPFVAGAYLFLKIYERGFMVL